MKAHTPGPWIAPIGFGDDMGFWVHPESERLKRIAFIVEKGMKGIGDSAPDADEAYANARLISAAPDLLSACHDAMAALIAMTSDNETEEERESAGEQTEYAITKLNAAINKAEGRE